MSDQITLSGFEPLNVREVAFYNQILPYLQAAAVELGAQAEDVRLEENKDYSAVYWRNSLAFRLRIRKKTNYIAVPLSSRPSVENLAPFDLQAKTGDDLWRVNLWDVPVEDCAAALASVVRDTINRQPKDWDCCSRYLECSNAKRCVHPDPTFALGCGYRKILTSGEIYYGENRNVD